MNGNLIDTNVIVKIFRGDNDTEQILDNINPEEIFISVISLGELYYGALKSSKSEENIKIINEFTSFYKVLKLNSAVSFCYSEIKNKVHKSGFTLPENDLWIAATAIKNDLTVITYDKHFENIPDIKLYFK